MYLHKVISRKTFFYISFLLASWRSMMKIAWSGSRFIRQKHGSADPDPHQNVMDSEHCCNNTWARSHPCCWSGWPHFWTSWVEQRRSWRVEHSLPTSWLHCLSTTGLHSSSSYIYKKIIKKQNVTHYTSQDSASSTYPLLWSWSQVGKTYLLKKINYENNMLKEQNKKLKEMNWKDWKIRQRGLI